jgi:hypothetical protein
MKDLWDSFKHQLSERLSNPLLGSFVISWLVWNHRMVFVLFADMSAKERFDFIDGTLYPAWWVSWFCLLIGPLACSLLYIRFYPDVAKKINGYWLRQQILLKKQRDEIDGAILLTQEESQEIRKRTYERVRNAEEESRKLRDELDVTKKALHEAANPNSIEDQILARLGGRETPDPYAKFPDLKKALSNAPPRSKPYQLPSEGARKIVAILVKKNGRGMKHDILQEMKEPKIRGEHYVDEARNIGLISIETPHTGDVLVLNETGRAYAVAEGLT